MRRMEIFLFDKDHY